MAGVLDNTDEQIKAAAKELYQRLGISDDFVGTIELEMVCKDGKLVDIKIGQYAKED